jgi:hypothetical protein
LSKNLKIRIYKTIILSVILNGCENFSLTLREEHRLRVFENRLLRRIFGPKRDEVTGEWRKLHNGEQNNQVEEDETGKSCRMNGGEQERVQVIGGKSRGKETTRKTKT